MKENVLSYQSHQISQKDYQNNNRNSHSQYMLDTRKHYLLASNKDSLDTLFASQKEELTKVLVHLKSAYDLIIRESAVKKELIEEYNKKIFMLQKANNNYEKKQEEKKEESDNIKDGLDIKKNTRNEEIYTKQTLEKQADKLSNDLILIQKKIFQCQNESIYLDKKKERLKVDENIIKTKKNQIQFKIDEQKAKNKHNKNEYDLQIEYYETVIEQKSAFIEYSDMQKNQQKNERLSKIDSQDKQEVERRRKLLLLILYNQYLKSRIVNQLKKYEKLEYIFQQIKNICGNQDLCTIINFILERGKRYNYNIQLIEEKQKKISQLNKEVKKLKEKLKSLKNEVIFEEKTKKDNSGIEMEIKEHQGLNQKDIAMIEIENEKNEKLRNLGEKYNEVNLAYNQVLANIKSMKNYDLEHPLDLLYEGEKEKVENEKEKEEIYESKKIELKKEEEENIVCYKNLLKKILKVFNILYLCRSKQDFISLMRKKGMAQQEQKTSENKISENKNIRINKRNRTRRLKRKNSIIITSRNIFEDSKKTKDDAEEEDFSTFDPDNNIMNKFINQQKKDVDYFINIKNVELKKSKDKK